MIANRASNTVRNKKIILLLIFTSIPVAAVLGSAVAKSKMPLEENIEMNPAKSLDIGNNKYTIKYFTTGPEFSEFKVSHADYTIVSDFDAIIMNTDGNSGTVEIHLPARLMEEYDGILGKARVTEITTGSGKELEFDRISNDNLFTVVRANLPADDYRIRIVFSQIDLPPFVYFVLQTMIYGGMIWFALFLAGVFTFLGVESLIERKKSEYRIS